jgi:hypothetical protein
VGWENLQKGSKRNPPLLGNAARGFFKFEFNEPWRLLLLADEVGEGYFRNFLGPENVDNVDRSLMLGITIDKDLNQGLLADGSGLVSVAAEAAFELREPMILRVAIELFLSRAGIQEDDSVGGDLDEERLDLRNIIRRSHGRELHVRVRLLRLHRGCNDEVDEEEEANVNQGRDVQAWFVFFECLCA